MTRTKKAGHRGGGGGKGRGRGRAQKADTFRDDIIDKSDMTNSLFATYYKAQKIVPEEAWDSFLDALKQPLPTTFRLTGSREIASELNATIKDTYVPSLTGCVFEGELLPPPVQIPWYPEGLAWQFNVPKKVLRKSPEFKKFHSFLVFETEVGNVSRQEAVSMLPPLFLDVEPHHRVIDMCAAPGSKTAQLLEALHARDTISSSSMPSGLLIANDSDNKRTHLLIHQSARLPSPALMVTNLDASIYPILKIPASDTRGTASKRVEQLLFDRILCDVPCSGDGTLRKNLGIWKSWQPMDGNGLHGLQVRILQRAMKMLKEDGRIVYSTCSLNPVENEAVIAAALLSIPGFEIVDVSARFPELKREPGLTTWRPTADRTVSATYETYDDFLKALSDSETNSTKMTQGHWPPINAESLGLTRCLRIYPHIQDTGGFFVAVLQKKRTIKSYDDPPIDSTDRKREADEPVEIPDPKKPRLADEGENEVEPSNETYPIDKHDSAIVGTSDEALGDAIVSGDNSTQKRKEKLKETGGSFKENPYTFLSPDDLILQSCIERLNLTSEFPSTDVLVRSPNGDALRVLYLTNGIVKSVIQHNDYNRIRLTSAGTKVFAKQESGKGIDAQYRILGEGLPVALPYIKPETIMTANTTVIRTLVQSYYPLCAAFTEPFKAAIEAQPSGCHIVRFTPDETGKVLSRDLVLPIWKSNVSITLMIDKKAKSALSLRLFGQDITTVGRETTDRKANVVPAASSSTLAVDVNEDTEMIEENDGDI